MIQMMTTYNMTCSSEAFADNAALYGDKERKVHTVGDMLLKQMPDPRDSLKNLCRSNSALGDVDEFI